ncbi:MAG: SulP family inorganic anion transporter [Hyphomicrobiaceae bacterium]
MTDTSIRPPKPGFDFASYLRSFTPKLVIALREGYPASRLSQDALSGITVAILALPLSMAIAIGAGISPDKGLITAVVAGFLISAFGGSRHQIGGPAAAFIVIIASLVTKYGEAGMLTATFLAGFLLVIAALLKVGTYVKYVPGPVILGFTSGVGALIAIGQLKDLMGLKGDVPADILPKIKAMWAIRDSFNPSALVVGLLTLGAIVALKQWRPKWPGLLSAVVGASAAVAVLHLPIETIGSRFGGIAASLPVPTLPDLSPTMIGHVFPSALTFAFLIGVESLLSAVAADAITGGRHRSNVEILGQGIANIASPMFGGMPATGVIARTGANISAGGQTPVAGILHAVFVLIAMVALAPLAAYLALPCLAAVLIHVAWRLLDVHEMIGFLRKAPRDDALVLAATWLLTVFVSLDVAIAVGVVMASVLFVHRMAEANGATMRAHSDDEEGLLGRLNLPASVRLFQMRGPMFFGAAETIARALEGVMPYPKAIILDMGQVPLIDATAIAALEDLAKSSEKHGCQLLMCGLDGQPRRALHTYGFLRAHKVVLAATRDLAIEKAKVAATA